MRKLLLHIIQWLTTLTYETVTLDKVNKKMIKPVPSLIIDGQQYYEFVQVADMPQNRFVHYLDFRSESQMGVTREVINGYLDGIMAANNEGNVSFVGAQAFMLKDSINNCTNIEVLYNMASLLYFTKDEDISCYDLDYNERKIRLFKQVKNKSFFFQNLLTNSLKITGKSLPTNIDAYLRQSMVKLSTYEGILTNAKEKRKESSLS